MTLSLPLGVTASAETAERALALQVGHGALQRRVADPRAGPLDIAHLEACG
jgi:hypothetical protein